MPTKRRRITRGRLPELSAYQLAWLLDRDLPEPTSDDSWWRMVDGRDSARALWLEHQAALMAAWVADRPGYRPRCWWLYSAPRQPLGTWAGWWCDGKLMLPRERLGGVGTPAFEVLAYAPVYDYGIPAQWVDPWDVAYYNGLALDANGKRIGAEHSNGGFKGVAIDPNDPPIYEAQATYLDRHNLLLPGERRRLKEADFESERVVYDEQTA